MSVRVFLVDYNIRERVGPRKQTIALLPELNPDLALNPPKIDEEVLLRDGDGEEFSAKIRRGEYYLWVGEIEL